MMLGGESLLATQTGDISAEWIKWTWSDPFLTQLYSNILIHIVLG